jgi:hypothetical protein
MCVSEVEAAGPANILVEALFSLYLKTAARTSWPSLKMLAQPSKRSPTF